MHATDARPPLARHLRPVDVCRGLIDVTGGGAGIPRLAVIVCLGLLVWWPWMIIATAVAAPGLVTSAVLAAAVTAMLLHPWLLARRVHCRHRALDSTPVLNLLWP